MAGTTHSRVEGAATGNGRRYLRYERERDRGSGLDHARLNLECLMREAHQLGRTALLPPLELDAAHNFGVARDWRWETYYDLAASRLVAADGTESPLPLARRARRGLRPFRVAAVARVPSAARDAALVVRRLNERVYGRDVRFAARPPPGFRMAPSARVAALARPVLRELARLAPGGFAAVHVRRRDYLLPPVARRTHPEALRGRLARFGVVDGAVLFVLSNESDDAWWAGVGRHYRLVRATDFPGLGELVRTGQGALPDNYLLYAVEKEVMRHAVLKVETMPGRRAEPVHGTLLSRVDWALAFPKAPQYAVVRWMRRLLGERAWAAQRLLRRAWRRRSLQ